MIVVCNEGARIQLLDRALGPGETAQYTTAQARGLQKALGFLCGLKTDKLGSKEKKEVRVYVASKGKSVELLSSAELDAVLKDE